MKGILVFYIVFAIVFAACQGPGKTDGEETARETSSGVPALDSLDGLIQRDSLNPELFYQRSLILLADGESNKALADINKAMQLKDNDADYYVALADIYLAINKVPGCLEALLKARDLDPENNDALLKLAEVYLVLKDYDNTFKYSGLALDNDRINPVAHFIRGYAYLELGDTALAVKNFQAAADLDQGYYEAYVQLGILYSIVKDPVAAGYLQTATRIDPNRTEGWYLLGMAYQEQENVQKALETYDKLLAIAPQYKEALYNIGYIHLVYTADYVSAVDYFSRAIAIDPKYTDALFNRGYSHELAGDLANARKDYQRALEVTPNYDRAIDGLNRLDR